MTAAHDAAIAEAMEFARDAVVITAKEGRALYGFKSLPLHFVFDSPDASPRDLAERIIEQSLIARLQSERAFLVATPEGKLQ